MRKYTIDILAFSVALMALGFSIWQGWTQIEHNHITVEPRVNSYFSNNSKEGKWGIYLINNGMGTAFVSELTVLVDGVEVPDHEWGKFFSALRVLDLNVLCFTMEGPRENDSFQVGKEQFLIEASEETSITSRTCPAERLRFPLRHTSCPLD